MLHKGDSRAEGHYDEYAASEHADLPAPPPGGDSRQGRLMLDLLFMAG